MPVRTDESGTTTYSYKSMDRLIAKATPEGTLNYTYDAAGHVASIASSNANGASMAYTYDSLNRLSTVTDNRTGGVTNYSYDAASNVATVTYPNGVQTLFHYDTLNRVMGATTQQTGYIYQRGPTGNLTSVMDANGRTVNWSYDGIYRLTGETISLDPAKHNGSVGYGLDPVGNRLSETSTLAGVSSGSFGYNADDELATETYDQNGNVLTSGGKSFSYDAENHLVAMNGGAVQMVYDAFGNRVAKSANGVTTRYLVDDLNPTGYPQVFDELTNGIVTHTYAYGLQRISETQAISNTWTTSYYGYDGMGTVRQLTNAAGAITDTYDYDAFGNLINSTGTTPNNYLYRGEQWDADLGLYYLRARYMNPLTGRLLSRDPESGVPTDPATLHKYEYASGDPANLTDPTGRAGVEYAGALSLESTRAVTAVSATEAVIACVLTWDATKAAAEIMNGILYQNTGDVYQFSPCVWTLKKKNCTLGGNTQTVVIGENMAHRVIPYAMSIDAGYYLGTGRQTFDYDFEMARNRMWINEVMDQNCKIIDAGPSPDKKNYPLPTSDFYIMELGQIGARGYPTEPPPTPVPWVP